MEDVCSFSGEQILDCICDNCESKKDKDHLEILKILNETFWLIQEKNGES